VSLVFFGRIVFSTLLCDICYFRGSAGPAPVDTHFEDVLPANVWRSLWSDVDLLIGPFVEFLYMSLSSRSFPFLQDDLGGVPISRLGFDHFFFFFFFFFFVVDASSRMQES